MHKLIMVLEIKKRESVNKRNNHDYKCSEHKQVADPVEILREYKPKQDQNNMASNKAYDYLVNRLYEILAETTGEKATKDDIRDAIDQSYEIENL